MDGQQAGWSVAIVTHDRTETQPVILQSKARKVRGWGSQQTREEGMCMLAGGTRYSTKKRMVLIYHNSRPGTIGQKHRVFPLAKRITPILKKKIK